MRWRSVYLDILQIGLAVSPIHEPESGKKKKKVVKGDSVEEMSEISEGKKHCHVVLAFESLKSWSQVDTAMNSLMKADSEGRRAGITRAFPVDSLAGLCRYLIHLDDKDKQQFSDSELEDCKTLSSINVESYWDSDLSDDEKETFLEECEDKIMSGAVRSLCELIRIYAKDAKRRKLIRRNYTFFSGLFREVRSYGAFLSVAMTENYKKQYESFDKKTEVFNIFSEDEHLPPIITSDKAYSVYLNIV